MNVNLATPYVFIPKRVTSRDHVLLDLGKINVSTGVSMEGENKFSEFKVSIKGLEMVTNHVNSENGKIEKSLKMLQDLSVEVSAKVIFYFFKFLIILLKKTPNIFLKCRIFRKT